MKVIATICTKWFRVSKDSTELPQDGTTPENAHKGPLFVPNSSAENQEIAVDKRGGIVLGSSKELLENLASAQMGEKHKEKSLRFKRPPPGNFTRQRYSGTPKE